jgi:hypothetical protein
MSKLGAAKTFVEIGAIITSAATSIFDRVRKISDMDGRIKKLEEDMTNLKEKK